MSRAADLAGSLLLVTYGLLAGFVLMLVIPIVGFLWETRPWVLVVVGAALAFTANALRLRLQAKPVANEAEGLPALHPGIRIDAIPVAGGIGLAIVLGYLVMFWFGLPGLRPVVVGVAIFGSLLGVALIWLHRQRSP